MKVVILAGGFGSRLGRITELIPKPMVKIGERPILWHIMNYFAHFGHKDFIICLGFKGDVIKQYFFNYQFYNSSFTINLKTNNVIFHGNNLNDDWNVTLVDTGLNTLKGGRIKRIEDYLDDVNLLTYGDGLSNIDINKLIEFHQSHNKILTISGVHPPSRFGELVVEEGNKVKDFSEKPQSSHGIINGGFMVINKEIVNYLEHDSDLEIGPFSKLANDGEIMVYKHDGFWECVDNERDLDHLNKLWINKQAPWIFNSD